MQWCTSTMTQWNKKLKKKRTTSHTAKTEFRIWIPLTMTAKLHAKKGKNESSWKEKKTDANNKASSMKPDGATSRILISMSSHLSSSSILSLRLVHSYEKIMSSLSQWFLIILEQFYSVRDRMRFFTNLLIPSKTINYNLFYRIFSKI